MKQSLSPAVIGVIAVVLIAVIGAAGFFFMKSSDTPQASKEALTPKPWAPPSNWSHSGDAPGTVGTTPKSGQ